MADLDTPVPDTPRPGTQAVTTAPGTPALPSVMINWPAPPVTLPTGSPAAVPDIASPPYAGHLPIPHARITIPLPNRPARPGTNLDVRFTPRAAYCPVGLRDLPALSGHRGA